MILHTHLIDIFNETIYAAEVVIENGIIAKISKTDKPVTNYILPGFTDAHIHIESSMLVPSEFARLAVVHGTVATVSDPHEIANVMGIEGVNYMIENGNQVPFYFNFGAPSCVPATVFETAGATINANEIDLLLARPEIKYLTEMMNYPGVLFKDEEVLQKIAHAKKHGKPTDGHAPGLKGQEAIQYINAGITTDHECFTYEEALHKVKHGMKILIREGSAAKNFEALIPLLDEFPDKIMFCSDDKHPNDLVEGHINELVKRALAKGINLFKVLRAACLNPVLHYGLEHGLLKVGDAADFIKIDSLEDFNILQTYIKGELVAENGKSFIEKVNTTIINNFHCQKKSITDFSLKALGEKIKVIEALDGQLITQTVIENATIQNGNAVSNVETDILKITVVNRYEEVPPTLAFIKNFGLKAGAIASCVGHDSHNIIAVGTNDEDLCQAVNLIIQNKGGLSLSNGSEQLVLPLPVAGILTNADAYEVAKLYTQIDAAAKTLGTKLHAPFMTLSFMALLVIPQLKLSDKGLFDGSTFEFTELFL